MTLLSEVKHNESKQLSLIGLIHLVPNMTTGVNGLVRKAMLKIVVRIRSKENLSFFILIIITNVRQYAYSYNQKYSIRIASSIPHLERWGKKILDRIPDFPTIQAGYR
jgi:hypothetical protein